MGEEEDGVEEEGGKEGAGAGAGEERVLFFERGGRDDERASAVTDMIHNCGIVDTRGNRSCSRAI